MAAFGTEKFQTTSLNLGMPTAFQNTYARFGPREVWAPQQQLGRLNNTVGNDFQAQWHQQKMRDAHHMSRAKVQSTRLADVRAYTSPHNHPDMPKAVLGQRKFANPSNGAWESSSARVDQFGAPWTLYEGSRVSGGSHMIMPYMSMPMNSANLMGGVLRTSAGQRHGKTVLDARIQQLNAIADAKMNFITEVATGRPQTSPTTFAGAQGTMDGALSSAPLVELANLLQGIKDHLMSNARNKSSFRDVLADETKAFGLIVRMAVSNTTEDIANVLEFIEGTSAGDGIGQLLESEADEFGVPEDEGEAQWHNQVTQQIEWWGKIATYLKEMIKLGDAPLRNKQLASTALIKTLGFNKLQRSAENQYRTNVVNEDTFIDTTGNVHNPQNAQRAIDLQARAGSSGAFINPLGRMVSAGDEYASKFKPYDRSRQYADPQYFTPRGEIREDSQMGYVGDGGEQFSKSAQEAYAFGSGEYQDNTGGRPRAWYGEEEVAEYGEQPQEADIIEEEEQATLPMRDEGLAPMMSRKDPTTQEYDIATGKEGEVAPKAPKASKPYTLSDLPRDLEGMRSFIKTLNAKHGYNQAIYSKGDVGPKASNVRRNLIKRMTESGLL